MNAIWLVLLTLAASVAPKKPMTVTECMEAALAKPPPIAREIIICADARSTEELLGGLSHEYERENDTERIRSVLWSRLFLSGTGWERDWVAPTPRLLEELERRAPERFHRSFLTRFNAKPDGLALLVSRARKRADAFGRRCALAVVEREPNDPAFLQMVWDGWLDAPDAWTFEVLTGNDTLATRLREHLKSLRSTKQAPRREDFDVLRRLGSDDDWEQLFAWVASEDRKAARIAVRALADEPLRRKHPIPSHHRVRARGGIAAIGFVPDDKRPESVVWVARSASAP